MRLIKSLIPNRRQAQQHVINANVMVLSQLVVRLECANTAEAMQHEPLQTRFSGNAEFLVSWGSPNALHSCCAAFIPTAKTCLQ